MTGTVVCHRPTRSYFGVMKEDGDYNYFENIGGGGDIDNLSGLFVPRFYVDGGSWDGVGHGFSRWLNRVRECVEYLEEPDLWAELARFREVLSDTGYENTTFTRDEQAEISARIERAKEDIRASGELTSEQISRIEARLDHAEEASKRVGRKDWLMVFNGAVFSLALTDTITPQVAQHIFMLVVQGLGHAIGYGGPPPQLP